MNIQRNSNGEYTSVGASVIKLTDGKLPDGTTPVFHTGEVWIGQAPVTAKQKAYSFEIPVASSQVTWRAILTPASVQVTLSDVDLDAGRTSGGKMKRNKKAIKRSVACEMRPMTTSEISTILRAIDTKDKPTVDVTLKKGKYVETITSGLTSYIVLRYVDPWQGSTRVARFYAGDRVAPLYSGALGLWESLNLDFVEM